MRFSIYVVASFILQWGCAPKMLPQPLGKIDKATAIELFLQHELDPIEGLWLWQNGNYEIAIVENALSLAEAEYDYVGVVTSTTARNWHRGEIKLLLKKTAEPSFLIGLLTMKDKSATRITASILGGTFLRITPQQFGFGHQNLSLVRSYPSPVSISDSSTQPPEGTVRLRSCHPIIRLHQEKEYRDCERRPRIGKG